MNTLPNFTDLTHKVGDEIEWVTIDQYIITSYIKEFNLYKDKDGILHKRAIIDTQRIYKDGNLIDMNLMNFNSVFLDQVNVTYLRKTKFSIRNEGLNKLGI